MNKTCIKFDNVMFFQRLWYAVQLVFMGELWCEAIISEDFE